MGEDPDEPDDRREDGDGDSLLEDFHPCAGFGEDASPAGEVGEGEVGQCESQSEGGEDGEADDDRMGERVADGGAHEGRCAGRGDDHGKDAGEEAAGVAVFLREGAAGAGEGEADFELSGEGESKEEEKHRHEGEEGGGLELESPAKLLACGAEDDKDGDYGPEGDEDAEGVDPAVGAELAAFLLRGLDEREAFDEEDGKDAGHEVEEDSADEG